MKAEKKNVVRIQLNQHTKMKNNLILAAFKE